MSVPEFRLFGVLSASDIAQGAEVPLTLADGTVVGTATLMPDGSVEGFVTDPGTREKLACHARDFTVSVGAKGVRVDGV